MSHPLLGANYEPATDGSGQWVSANFRRLGEIINDYNPNFWLVWIPPANRGSADLFPYGVLDETPGRAPYIMFHLREDELDERVIERIWAGDQGKRDVFGEMQRHNDALELMRLKKLDDEIEARKDFARSLLKSPLNKYKHKGRTYE